MGLEQNVPNPFDCETRVELAVLHREDVRMQLLDVAGQVCAEYTGSLSEGVHVFDISAANPQTYILNAIIGSRSYSIRMVNVGSGCGCCIKYSGLGKGIVQKFETANEFELGDDMRFVGYATINGDMLASDTVEQSLSESQCVTLHFTRSLPHVETLAASDITNISAILHGQITDNGGSSIIACGFYYGTSEDDLSQNATVILTDSMFSYELAGLTTGATYYYKAYAINNVGTGYGEVRYFVATDDIYMADGIDMNLECGQTYNFYDSGGLDGNYTTNEDMTAIFTANGLITLSFSSYNTENNMYDYMYVYDGDTDSGNVLLERWCGNVVPSPVTAYSGTMTIIWRSDGCDSRDGWEATISVDCQSIVPVVRTSVASDITSTGVILNGIVINDGWASIIACGFYYGTSEDDLSQNVPATLTDNRFSYELIGLAPDSVYYYMAYAINSIGTGYGEVRSFNTYGGYINGHAYVDLGLPSGLLWATCNVGSDTPEGYGDYFAWGETIPKEYYDWSTYRYCNGSYRTLTKYCYDAEYGNDGFTDTLTTLESSDDAATANWGEGWRMPTNGEFAELISNCTVIWTIYNGVSGYLFSGPNGNTIFLSTAGMRFLEELNYDDIFGQYWSSSLVTQGYGNSYAFYLDFFGDSLNHSSDYCDIKRNSRFVGQSVRPVCSPQN